MDVQNVPVEKIKVGEYVSRVDEEDKAIVELSASIRRVGVLVPLVVVASGEGFILVAGHRRLAACRQAGLQQVPCCVRSAAGAEAKEVSFAENLFRRDLSPIELAAAIADCLKQEIMTVPELAAGLRRSENWVRQQVAILAWPSDVLEAIHGGKISVSAASNLAQINDSVYREFLVRQAVENGATARATAAWLQAWRSMAPAAEAITREPVQAGERSTPAVPQAPCIVCSNVFRTDELSHVPICSGCIRTIRDMRSTG